MCTRGNTSLSIDFYICRIYFVFSSVRYRKMLLKRWCRSNTKLFVFPQKVSLFFFFFNYHILNISAQWQGKKLFSIRGHYLVLVSKLFMGLQNRGWRAAAQSASTFVLLRINNFFYSLTELPHHFTMKGRAVIRIRFSVLF